MLFNLFMFVALRCVFSDRPIYGIQKQGARYDILWEIMPGFLWIEN